MRYYIATPEEKRFIQSLKQSLPEGPYNNFHNMAVDVFSQLLVGNGRFLKITDTAIYSICNARNYKEDSLNEIVGYAKEKFLEHSNDPIKQQDFINTLGMLNVFINQNHQGSSFGSQPTILARLFYELSALSPVPSRAPSVGSSADGGSSVSISQVSTNTGGSYSPSSGDLGGEWQNPDLDVLNADGAPLLGDSQVLFRYI